MLNLDMEHIMIQAAKREDRVHWTTPGLTDVHLVLETSPEYEDLTVIACQGNWRGTPVKVTVPFFRVPKASMRACIVEYAKQEGVYAKDLGILDNIEVRTHGN